MSRLVRSLSSFAAAGGLTLVVGCGASQSSSEFGASSDATDGGTGSEVLPPPTDQGVFDSGIVAPDAPTQAKCTATSSHNGTVCLRVDRGAAAESPSTTDEAASALQIDGDGVLLVALMPDPWVSTSKAVAVRTFPSASATPHFFVATDLPKTADLDVPPGRYFAFAVFYDKPGFGSRDLSPGDWTPRMADTWDVPEVDIAGGDALDVTVHLLPLRAADLNVSLRSDVHPLGSGSGPLVASILTPKTTGFTVVGEGRLPCADLSTGAPSIRILTTAPPSKAGYPLRVGLYDFATGPDDPSLDAASTTAPPPGAILNGADGTMPVLSIAEGWQSPTTDVVLDRVIPFVGAPPSDPTPACTAYGAAPK